MVTNYNGITDEERKRMEEERLAREREAAEAAAAAEVEKAAAAAEASAEPQPPAAEPVQFKDIDRITEQGKKDAQYRYKVRKATENTKFNVTERNWDAGFTPGMDTERQKRQYTNKLLDHAMGDALNVTEGGNKITVDMNSIQDNDQAVYFSATLTSKSDMEKFLRDYAKKTKQDYQALLEYADEKLGTKLLSSPLSNAGKRKAYTTELEKIGLFDANGNDIQIGTADFDMVVQGLNNIADKELAKKAAKYVEALTKTPGSAYYGMTFDKDAVAYRDSANLPAELFKKESEALSGIFYAGDGHTAENQETYLAQYELIQTNYGSDPFAFRQMERALKNAYEKQTGYVAPESAKVQEAIKQIQADRELATAAEAEGEKKGFIGRWWDNLFGKEKVEEEAEEPILPEAVNTYTGPVAGQDYSVRSGYVASTGPSAGLLAENNQIKAAVAPPEPAEMETAPAQAEAEEAPAEVQGPQPQQPQQPKPQETIKQEPMSYMDALEAYARGEQLSEENWALIEPSISNNDFLRYAIYGATPDAKEMMNERAYGGTVLTDAQARIRANDITQGIQILGTELGGAAQALATGAMDRDTTGLGYQLMTEIMNDVSLRIRSGRVSVPVGENKYDYVIANTPYIKAKADQLAGLQKEYNQIMTERAMEKAREEEKALEDSELRFMNGTATPEDYVRLSANADTDVDLNEDETRLQFVHQLSLKSMWYQDDGAFWKGGSAAADEGVRLRQTREDGLYGDYKHALWEKANQVIDELTYIAADYGMTLGGWMEKAGLSTDDPSAIMDIAYNRMVSEGAQIKNDPETQEAINTIAGLETQGIGWLTAGWKGVHHGLADDAYHFMNAGYKLWDAATYESECNRIMRESHDEYGYLAPYVRRQQLIAYANSGAMSKELSRELLEDIERCNNIFDIPLDIDPSLIEGLYMTGINHLAKYTDELESVRELLPENERDAFDAMSGLSGNLAAQGRSVLTTIGASAIGVPLPITKALGMWMGHGAVAFSRGTEKYENAGMSREAAMFMGASEAASMMMINLVGNDMATSMVTGKTLTRRGIEKAFKDGGWFGAMKVVAGAAKPLMLEEAKEEVYESLAESGIELTAPAVQAAYNGELTSFSQAASMTLEEFKGMDVKEVLKNAYEAGKGGAIYGLLFGAPMLAVDTYRGRANAKVQKLYPSVDLASKIVHGEVEANEENMGRFIQLMQEDLAKPEFQTLLDKHNDSAEQANCMAVAAVLGEGHENREAAIALNKKADEYDKKAEAAEKSVEINSSQFYTARKAASEGNQGALHTMEGFRAAWGKAQTTATENRQAAEKARTEAAKHTSAWIHDCRKLGNNMYKISKTRAANLLIQMGEEEEADRLEKIAAADEANVDRMDAEAFIEERYKNASDAQKDHIREIYGVPVGEKQGPIQMKTETAQTETTAAEEPRTETTTETAAEGENAAEAAPASTPSEAIMPTETVQQEATQAAETTQEPAQTEAATPVAHTTAATEAQAAAAPATSQNVPTTPAVEAKPIQTQTGAQRIDANKKRQINNAVRFAGQVQRRFGVEVVVAPANDERLKLPKPDKDGNPRYAPALYDRKTDTIVVGENATQDDVIRAKVIHELTHRTENTKAYEDLSKALIGAYFKGNENNKKALERTIMNTYRNAGVELSAEDLNHELVARAAEELIGGNADMVNRLVADSPSVARRILNAIGNVLAKLTGVKTQQVDQLRELENMFRTALDEAQTQRRDFSSDNIQYSLREKEPPKNVVYAYKAFYARDGKLYPPMVSNITDDADKQQVKKATSGTMKSLPTPVGVWLDADIGGIMTDEYGTPVRSKDTKRLRVKNDKSGGGATLAFRPGWHLGEWPDAKQFNKADPVTGERGKRMPDDLVFAKCEVSADIDYQLDALSYGLNDKGSFSRSQAGLPYVPDDGYYKYRTNVDPTTAPWLIAGSIKVVEILDDADCARICAEFGVTPDQRYSGEPINLSKYGLKRGPVEETTEGMEPFKENDANRANKKLLETALNDPEYADAYVQREIDFDNPKQYEQLQKEFAMNGQDIEAYRKKYETEGFASSGRAKVDAVSNETGEPLTATIGGDTVVQYSLNSWTTDEQQTVRSNLISKGYDPDAVDNWVDDVNSVAAIVAADRDRLDFEAADNQVMLKDNQEYVKTLDASTLCAKRLLYQGTFNAIQHRLPNKVLTSDELIKLRNMMAEAGYETPCGICYVESRRRNLGTFAKKWLDGYDAQGGYQPKLDDVTTTDGLERMRKEHPEVYESFIKEMNRKGSNNPKVVQLRTDYRGDIRKLSKKDTEKIVDIGGLRVQSFSDFETPHMLDMMQAVLDMTDKGLTSQAYTKVPNFAWVFGDTGIKINLSLIAQGNGFDADGNLAFSSYEGMNIDEAMALRNRYSKNVGTILVGLSDEHIKAAMADPRIDFIIPFHKSGWGKRQLSQLSGMSGYKDYTKTQNERMVIGQTKTGKPKTKNVSENFHPVGHDQSGYWDFDKTGDENAATYLRMCEEDGRIPKFNQFLTKDADGHWVAPSGYWKLLIDFKMYDNDGVGAPQMPVMPYFNMTEAMRVLDQYEGGADELPVAQDIVEQYVSQNQSGNDVQYALDDIYNYTEKTYNERGWMKVNDIISENEYAVIGKRYSDLRNGDHMDRTADGKVIFDVGHEFGINPVVVVTNGGYINPKYERVYRIYKRTENQIERYRYVIHEAEAGEEQANAAIADAIEEGVVGRYDRQDFGTYAELKREADLAGAGKGRRKNPRGGSGKRIPGGVLGWTGSDVNNGDIQLSIDTPSLLPDDDTLRAEIEAWKQNASYSVSEPEAKTGKRQFANETLPSNQYVPDYIKQEFLRDPSKSDYGIESNMATLSRAWNRINSEGTDAAKERLLAKQTKFDTEDNADALILMRQAMHEGDLDTFMAVATKYNVEGTDQGKALQIRSMMRKMTPTGFAQWMVQNARKNLDKQIEDRPGRERKITKERDETQDRLNLGALDDSSAADKIARGESIEIDSKFGESLNEVKQALIKEFKLEKVARPGDFYNWASTKQRMLEDILTTDDVWATDSNGMNLVDRLIRMKHGQPVVTKADIAYITKQMGLFERMADKNSREADLALSRAYEAQGNIGAMSGREKRRTWRYISMLTSVPSAARNVIGNTAQSVPNAAADGLAVELDRIISKFTGERTRAHLTAKDRIEGWQAFREEVYNTFRDYYIDKSITQHGEGRYNQSQRGRVYETQALETLRHLEGLLMSVGDRNFWKKKFLNSLAEQQHLAEINGTEFDAEAAMEIAEREANYATFNEDSKVRDLMSALTDTIPFLDYLMPFTGVPTNIIKRQIQFSPIGLATTAFKHGWRAVQGRAFDQRDFVDGMARGLTGTAMMAIGAALLKGGVLKLGTKEEDDDKSYGIRTAMGDQYGVYFTVGDKNYSITTFSPAASALVAGAFVMDALDNNENWAQAFLNGTLKNINEIFDASYMSALGDVLNTSNGKSVIENLVPAIGSAMVTQNIPAPLTHWASSMDEYVRDTKDKDAMMEVVKTVMNKIPGARELLPAKVDVAGRMVENTKHGAAAFYDPFTTSYVADDPALSEMMRLRDVLEAKGASDPRGHMASDALSGRKNTLTQNKVTYTVSEQEKEAYRSRYGELWRTGGRTYDKKGSVTTIQGVEDLIASRYYQLLDDEEKAKKIKEIITAAKTGATYETMNHK